MSTQTTTNCKTISQETQTIEEVRLAKPLALSVVEGAVSAYLFQAYGFNTQNIGMVFYMAAALVSEFWKANR